MTTKRIVSNFFCLTEPANSSGVVEKLLENQLQLINQKKVHNIKVSSFYLRITFLEKKTAGDDYWWVGIIERLETTEEVESSNLEGVKTTYASGVDEGPIVNTGFVYHPKTKAIALHKKISGVNYQNLGIFIRRLLKETNVLTKGINDCIIEVMPDLNKLDRLKRAPKILAIEYSIKMPENISELNSKNRTIVGDMLLASSLGGESMKVRISSNSMNVSETIRKVLKIRELGEDNINSLKAITEHNGIDEPLDLLTTKFTDFKDVEFKNGKKETPVIVMDVVSEIFVKQKDLIEDMYIKKEVSN